MTLVGLPRGHAGTLIEGLGKEEALLGSYKSKKLNIASSTVRESQKYECLQNLANLNAGN